MVLFHVSLSPCQVESSKRMWTLHGEVDYAHEEGIVGINTDRACAWSSPRNPVEKRGWGGIGRRVAPNDRAGQPCCRWPDGNSLAARLAHSSEEVLGGRRRSKRRRVLSSRRMSFSCSWWALSCS